ncbi:hypothetical protein KM043_014486 [Ampulex compressa]|nr:hypothetical protein KM043_014486 [Ampulex compressa]
MNSKTQKRVPHPSPFPSSPPNHINQRFSQGHDVAAGGQSAMKENRTSLPLSLSLRTPTLSLFRPAVSLSPSLPPKGRGVVARSAGVNLSGGSDVEQRKEEDPSNLGADGRVKEDGPSRR